MSVHSALGDHAERAVRDEVTEMGEPRRLSEPYLSSYSIYTVSHISIHSSSVDSITSDFP